MAYVVRSSGENSSKHPKIIILSPSAPPVSVGGIATAHFGLYQGLKSLGFSVQLATFADFGRARFQADADPNLRRQGSSRILAKGIQFLCRIYFAVREGSFRTRSYQTADVWKARAGTRRLSAWIDSEKPDFLVFPDQASPAAWLRKPPGQQWIQVSHHQALRFVNQPEIGAHSLRDALAARKFELRQADQCDLCVAPTHYMSDVVRSFTKDTLKILVISNLVAPPRREASSPRETGWRIFIPSGGSSFKGASVVPEFIAKLLARIDHSDACEFFISGSLSSAQREAILHRAPGARLVAPGHLSHSQVLAELARSQVCASPTWIENQSMALLEAKALGIPFVAFDVGGNREVCGVGDAVTPRGDLDAFAEAVVKALPAGKSAQPAPTVAWDVDSHNRAALDAWADIFNGAG